MRRAPFKSRLSSAVLVVVVAMAVAMELGVSGGSTLLAGAGILTFMALEWRRMARVARVTFLVGMGLLAWLYLMDQMSVDLLVKAVNRSAFFVFFVVSLDVLRDAATLSPLIKRCGKMIIDQPPGRRYAVLTFGGHLFGLLLNVGTLNLLGAMVRRTVDTGQQGVEDRVRQVRLKRMTLALLRGFCAITLWAPTSVTVVVVLSAIPDFDWYAFFPLGVLTSVVYVLLGWALDRLWFSRGQVPDQPESLRRVIRSLFPLFLLNCFVLGTTIVVSELFGLRMIGALLICVPVIGAGWIIFEYRRAGGLKTLGLARRRITHHLVPGLCDLRSEIGILAAAGFMSVLILSMVDIQYLSQMTAQLGLTQGMILVAALWSILALGVVGFNPIITVAVAVGIVGSLTSLDMNPHLLALTGTMGWALVTGYSPFAAANRLVSRCVRHSPVEVGMRWNAPFILLVLLLTSAVLLIFS
ncbi:hypothetical protein ACTL6U_20465 [Rhodovibrionaceae bacterium A322]